MFNRRPSVLFSAWFLAVGCALANHMFVQSTAGQEKKRDKAAVAMMVDKIANANPAPKIIEAETFDRIALFSTSYKWKEQSRVLRAIGELRKDTSDDLWEELVRKEEDPRYSLTVKDNGGFPENLTVGYFCHDLAHDRLVGVFSQHMPTTEEGRRVWLDNESIADLAKWRNKRKEKALYQLQIEYCEEMLTQFSKSTKFSADQKESVRKNVEGEIVKLKKTKKPIILPARMVGEEFDLFSADDAKRFREMVKEKQKK